MTAGENRKYHRNLREQPTARSLAFVGLNLAMLCAPIFAVLMLVGFTTLALHGYTNHGLGMLAAGTPALLPIMGNVRLLRQKSADLKNEGGTILALVEKEKRDFSEAERARLDVIKTELTAVNADLERVSAFAEQERAMPGIAEFGTGARADLPREAEKPFAIFGEQLQAIAKAERTNGRQIDPRLLKINEQAAASGMNEGVPADGGFAVQHDFQSTIVERIHAGGEIISRVNSTPVQGNGLKFNTIDESSRVDGSRWGGVQAYWAAEADTVTATKPKLRKVELELEKLMGIYYATNEELEDAPAMGSIASRAFSEELTFKAEDAIFNGTGAGMPLGFMLGGGTISVAKETSQVAATIVAENILKMWSRMPVRSRKSAIWCINLDCEPQLPQLNIKVKNVAGSENVGGLLTPIYQFPTEANPFGTIMGRPVIPVEYAATLGTVGDITFVDFSQYQLIQKASGVQSASSMHVRFLNDEMAFRVTWRLDGQPIWNKALTPKNGTNTLSPYVTLATR